jgi:hypothetical protein
MPRSPSSMVCPHIYKIVNPFDPCENIIGGTRPRRELFQYEIGPSAINVSKPTPFNPLIGGMTIGTEGLFSESRFVPSNAW